VPFRARLLEVYCKKRLCPSFKYQKQCVESRAKHKFKEAN